MKLEHPDRLMNRSSLSLAALECHDAFAERHIGPDSADQRAMLDALGFATRAAFIDAVIPESIRRKETLPLGAFTQPKSEAEALASLRKLADQNLVFRTYIGQGYYGTHTPAVILRNVLENPGVVHGLHAVSAGDFARAPGSAAELPADDHRPDGPRDLERVAARRSHRRRRSDDAAATRRQAEVERVLRRGRRAAADHRSRADAREAGSASR